jgi:hypothetical protein
MCCVLSSLRDASGIVRIGFQIEGGKPVSVWNVPDERAGLCLEASPVTTNCHLGDGDVVSSLLYMLASTREPADAQMQGSP